MSNCEALVNTKQFADINFSSFPPLLSTHSLISLSFPVRYCRWPYGRLSLTLVQFLSLRFMRRTLSLRGVCVCVCVWIECWVWGCAYQLFSCLKCDCVSDRAIQESLSLSLAGGESGESDAGPPLSPSDPAPISPPCYSSLTEPRVPGAVCCGQQFWWTATHRDGAFLQRTGGVRQVRMTEEQETTGSKNISSVPKPTELKSRQDFKASLAPDTKPGCKFMLP